MFPKFKKRRRRCLKCNRPFLSEGNWNRLCAKCNAANRGIANPPSSLAHWNGELMSERGRPL